MPPEAFIAHQAGDRLRLRIPSRKGDDGFFTHIERECGAWAGVSYAEANPLTASVLLHYHGPIDALAATAASSHLFALQLPEPSDTTVLDIVAEQVDRVERLILRRSRGALDLDALLFVGLVGAGVVQLARGNALGPTSTLLANAAAILALHRARRAAR